MVSSYSSMTDARAFNSLQLQCLQMSQVAATANRVQSAKSQPSWVGSRHIYTDVDKLIPIEDRVKYYTEPALPHYMPPTTPQLPVVPEDKDSPLNPFYLSDRDYDGYVGKVRAL